MKMKPKKLVIPICSMLVVTASRTFCRVANL